MGDAHGVVSRRAVLHQGPHEAGAGAGPGPGEGAADGASASPARGANETARGWPRGGGKRDRGDRRGTARVEPGIGRRSGTTERVQAPVLRVARCCQESCAAAMTTMEAAHVDVGVHAGALAGEACEAGKANQAGRAGEVGNVMQVRCFPVSHHAPRHSGECAAACSHLLDVICGVRLERSMC